MSLVDVVMTMVMLERSLLCCRVHDLGDLGELHGGLRESIFSGGANSLASHCVRSLQVLIERFIPFSPAFQSSFCRYSTHPGRELACSSLCVKIYLSSHLYEHLLPCPAHSS